jgi:hypothetical protein
MKTSVPVKRSRLFAEATFFAIDGANLGLAPEDGKADCRAIRPQKTVSGIAPVKFMVGRAVLFRAYRKMVRTNLR